MRSSQILIGINGNAGSGKDMVVDIAQRILMITGRTIVVRSFAEPIKRFVGDVYGFDNETLLGPSEARNNRGDIFGRDGPSARYALQTLGTEWGRSLHPDTWIRYFDRMLDHFAPEAIILIPDLRFSNEADYVIKTGGEVWHVDASKRLAKNRRSKAMRRMLAHASENGISETQITQTIDNNGPKEALATQVLRACANFMQAASLEQSEQHFFPLSLFVTEPANKE